MTAPTGSSVVKVARRYAGVVALLAIVIVLLNVLPSLSTTKVAASHQTSAAPLPGTPGLTVSGVHCGPGVRQVPWSKYAPICVPKWTGDNGGATAPGVTGTTITVSYRNVSSSSLNEFYAIVPPSSIGTNAEAVAALQAYVNLFNHSFELYGRQVKLVAFTGQSDFVNELTGSDQAAAKADADVAASDGAFADLSVIDATPVYDQYLAENHIISFTPFGGPASMFNQYSPYEYTTGDVCQKGNKGVAAIVERSLATTPTSFAGSGLNGRRRVFGLAGVDTLQSQECTKELAAQLAAHGVHVKVTVTLSLTNTQAAALAAYKLQKAGVTTVIATGLDFVTPITFMAACAAEHYFPEWFTSDLLDAFSRLDASSELAHAIALGNQAEPADTTEAFRAFKLGHGVGQLLAAYQFVYAPVLMLFDGLQAAGPDLTPETFQRGVRSLPTSLPGGEFGTWSFDKSSFDPYGGYSVVWWDPTVVSAADGQIGTWLACNGGKEYLYKNDGSDVPYGRQMACFSRSGG